MQIENENKVEENERIKLMSKLNTQFLIKRMREKKLVEESPAHRPFD